MSLWRLLESCLGKGIEDPEIDSERVDDFRQWK